MSRWMASVRLAAVVVVLVGVAGVATAAQTQRDRQVARDAQARDAQATPTGTGVVAGVVMSAGESPTPVRRASVLLASGQASVPRTALTDNDGQFAFVGLAEGNYTLAVRKPAWVPTVYGARSATDTQGIPIAVVDGQRVDGLRLVMARGAVVTGTVRLASGRPAENLAIQVLKTRLVDGRRQLQTVAAPAPTDDRGVYRVFGLAPGEYVVQARSQASIMQSRVTRQVTASEVRWGQAMLEQAQSPLQAAGSELSAPPEGASVTYSKVYYPGTAYTSDATVLSLGPGEERTGVDFSLTLVPTAQVSGTVLGPDGAPFPAASIVLTPEDDGASDIFTLVAGGGRTVTRPDGTFVLSGVTPGRYTVTVRGTPRAPNAMSRLTPARPAGNDTALLSAMAMMGGLFGGQTTATLWASEPIAVNGEDLGPMTLGLREGLRVEGLVKVEGLDVVPPAVTSLRIGLSEPKSGDPVMAMMSQTMSTIAATPAEDGTFVVSGLVPGHYAVTVSGLPMRVGRALPGLADADTGWVVKSIEWRGRDLADTGVDVDASESLTGVVVTLTAQPTELSGRVIDATGRPTGAFPIVVFSQDREFWTAGARRVRQAQPASDGRYTVVGLPAGTYYLAAVTRLEAGDLTDRQFLESLITASLPIVIADGEKKAQDLQLAGGGFP